jgi:hypothetical protein
MTWIDTIRQKPQAAKIRIMWSIAIVIAVLLIIVWVISAKYQKNVAKNTSFFQVLGRGIHNVKGSFKK